MQDLTGPEWRNYFSALLKRFTERARRVLFFARYGASQLGGTSIKTEHLLLGMVREGRGLSTLIFARSSVSLTDLRSDIERRTIFLEKVSTSVDMPLADE